MTFDRARLQSCVSRAAFGRGAVVSGCCHAPLALRKRMPCNVPHTLSSRNAVHRACKGGISGLAVADFGEPDRFIVSLSRWR
jgi:hypothetical protein